MGPILGALIALCLYTAALHFFLLGSVSPKPNDFVAPPQSIDASVKFWVTDYVQWHRQQRRNPKARRLIYTTISAGLGDNIRGLLRAYAFAVLTKRVFVIRWERPYPLWLVVSNNSMATFGFDRRVDVPDGIVVKSFHYMRMNKRQLYDTLRGAEETVVELACGPSPLIHDVLPILRGDHLSKVAIPRFDDAAIRAASHALFEPSQSSIERHRVYMNKFHLCGASNSIVCPNYEELSVAARRYARQYIGVQVRLGVGTHEYNTVRFKNLRGNQHRVARCFARRVRRVSFDDMADAHATIFLATDTPEFRRVFANTMRDVLPGSTVVWINKAVRHYAGLPSYGKNADYFQHLFDEIRVLGNAAHILSFESGFSYAANWLGSSIQLHTITYHECGVE